MKKIFIVLVIALIAFHGKSQQTGARLKLSATNYLEKSKTQRKTGLLLLGGGAACFGAGAYALEHAGDKNGYGAIIMLGGVGIAAASLPFFISSAITKRKAKISMRREAFMITPHHPSNISYNSVTLRFNL